MHSYAFFRPGNCAASAALGKSRVSDSFDTARSYPALLLYEVPFRTHHLWIPSHLTTSLRRDLCCVPSAQLLGTPMLKTLRNVHPQKKVTIAADLGNYG